MLPCKLVVKLTPGMHIQREPFAYLGQRDVLHIHLYQHLCYDFKPQLYGIYSRQKIE
jgi:hypothetical protein